MVCLAFLLPNQSHMKQDIQIAHSRLLNATWCLGRLDGNRIRAMRGGRF